MTHDHLYAFGAVIPERFEVRFAKIGDVPVIAGIHGATDFSQLRRGAGERAHEVDYRFEDVDRSAERNSAGPRRVEAGGA